MSHISRERAYEILKKYMVGENYLQHSLAVEAIMKKLASKLAPGKKSFGEYVDYSMIWTKNNVIGKNILKFMDLLQLRY